MKYFNIKCLSKNVLDLLIFWSNFIDKNREGKINYPILCPFDSQKEDCEFQNVIELKLVTMHHSATYNVDSIQTSNNDKDNRSLY